MTFLVFPRKAIRLLWFGLLLAPPALARPEGGSVIAGEATIVSGPGPTDINQSSQSAIIHWNSFNVGVTESVNFNQPDASSVTLNRVVGADPSQVMGRIYAPGKVFLLNPNGVFFGPSALIQVGSFVASTLDMTDEDFQQGHYNLLQNFDRELGAIVNRGTIHVGGNGGTVALVAPVVDNQGGIFSGGGKVLIKATTQAVVDPQGEVVPVAVPGASGRDVRIAEKFLQPGLEQLVNTESVASANRVERLGDGTVYLRGAGGIAHNSGIISVTSYNDRPSGSVEISADHVVGFSPAGFDNVPEWRGGSRIFAVPTAANPEIGNVLVHAGTGKIVSRALSVEADQVIFRTSDRLSTEEGSRFAMVTRITSFEEGFSPGAVLHQPSNPLIRSSPLPVFEENFPSDDNIVESAPEPTYAPLPDEPILLSSPSLGEPTPGDGTALLGTPALAPGPGGGSDSGSATGDSSGAGASVGSNQIGSSSDDPGASGRQPLRTLGDRDNVLLPGSRDSAARRPTDQSSVAGRISRSRGVTEITGPDRTSNSSIAGGLIRFENRTRVRGQNIDEVVGRPQRTGRSRDSARLERRGRNN